MAQRSRVISQQSIPCAMMNTVVYVGYQELAWTGDAFKRTYRSSVLVMDSI